MNLTRTTSGRVSAVALASILLVGAAGLSGCATGTAPAASAMQMHVVDSHTSAKASARTALYTAMRTLWDQHMQWTYDAVVAFASGSPALQPTLDRLLANQTDIGNAVAAYYGPAAGGALTQLLQTHIKDAVPVLVAAKAGDKAALETAVTTWYANAQDIADFLAKANPRWSAGEMRSMMKEHITQTIGYASDVLGGNFTQAIAGFDQAQRHMDQMADMLSAGIIAQFPKKF